MLKTCIHFPNPYTITTLSLNLDIPMPTLGERIKTLREENGLSQAQLAEMLQINRATLVQLEADNRGIKADELKQLSRIFDVSVDFLLNDYTTESLKITGKMQEKFEHLMLYILSKVGGQHNVGKVVLYKLLYFAEFDYYELHQKHLSGYPFIRLPMGPAPYNFNVLVEKMEEKKLIATMIVPYYNQYQQRFIANVPVQAEKRFTPAEKNCIDEVLLLYADL
jgi:transcriptional regulator with XRE-family HTH domain